MTSDKRETFASRFGLLMTMIGVAVGLGNVWRFPYMVGQFGGAPFVVVYVLAVALIGVPALMAEWILGRETRRGTVGAFQAAGMPFGRQIGWFFFAVILAATGYYTNALGWVLLHAVAELAGLLGIAFDAGVILPPAAGLDGLSLGLQLICSVSVIAGCAVVLHRGLRSGIEPVSKIIMPALLIILTVLIVRAVTLPGAGAGIRWYILKFEPEMLSGAVVLAALGQAVFSLSLGGTFMVVYGSYMNARDRIPVNAVMTAGGDVLAGLLAGMAIIPAVFALGLEPGGGPGLIFSTLPGVFARIPAGWLFGLLFFVGLFGAAFLSDIAAFEVLVAGLTDNTRLPRRRAILIVAVAVFIIAIPPMINMAIFVPWDLTFGSGMQTLGALCAVIAVGWSFKRAVVLRQIGAASASIWMLGLYYWLRFVIPGGIICVGIWWLATAVF